MWKYLKAFSFWYISVWILGSIFLLALLYFFQLDSSPSASSIPFFTALFTANASVIQKYKLRQECQPPTKSFRRKLVLSTAGITMAVQMVPVVGVVGYIRYNLQQMDRIIESIDDPLTYVAALQEKAEFLGSSAFLRLLDSSHWLSLLTAIGLIIFLVTYLIQLIAFRAKKFQQQGDS